MERIKIKVHYFWEGHKNNLYIVLTLLSNFKKRWEILFNFVVFFQYLKSITRNNKSTSKRVQVSVYLANGFPPKTKIKFWIKVLLEKILLFFSKTLQILARTGLLLQTAKKVPDYLLVWGIGGLWRTWMIPNRLYMSPSKSPDHPGSILYHSESSEVPYSTNQ